MEGLTIPTIDGLIQDQMRKLEALEKRPIDVPTCLTKFVKQMMEKRKPERRNYLYEDFNKVWRIVREPTGSEECEASAGDIALMRDAMRLFDEAVLKPISDARDLEKKRAEAILCELRGERKRKEHEIHDEAAGHWEASVKKQKVEAPAEPKT